MYPILCSFSGLHIYSYGFMVALAFTAGIICAICFAKKEGIAADVILDLAVYVIIAGIVGARLFYVVGQWGEYQNNLMDILAINKGGLVFLGGFLFDLAAVVWFAKKKNIPLLKLLDILAPGSALGYAVGRTGCFLNGCCFGVPASVPWAVKFPAGALAFSYFPNQLIHPTQIYSILFMALAFLVLLYIYSRKKFAGQVFYCFFLFYGIYRLIVEFFRFSPLHWLGLTPSQWLAMIFMVVAGFGLSRNGK